MYSSKYLAGSLALLFALATSLSACPEPTAETDTSSPDGNVGDTGNDAGPDGGDTTSDDTADIGADNSPDIGTDTPDIGPDTPDIGTDVSPDIVTDIGPDIVTDIGPDTALPPFEWPVPTEPVTIAAHESWKNALTYHDDGFKSSPVAWDKPEARWVKFAVLMKDPTKVYFQNSFSYLFHYDFATERLAPFVGLSHAEFDAVSLNEAGQEVILGAVIYSPLATTREIGIQLVRQDAYHPEMVRIVFDLVKSAVTPETPAEGPIEAFYFPTFEQLESTITHADVFAANNVPVSNVARWTTTDGCYSNGWAVGKLTEVPGGDIAAAYTAGTLKSNDILLTDGVPAEVPHVAGIATLTPSTPNSHVAILAATFNVPFAHIAADTNKAAAQALVGKTVLLRVHQLWEGCSVDILDVDGLPQVVIDEILTLKATPTLAIVPKATTGVLSASTDTLAPSDIANYGGKASNFGLLRDTIPNNSPTAIAFSFDLWDQFMAQTLAGGGTLESSIEEILGGYSWPPDIAALSADLAAIRTMIKDDTVFEATLETDVVAALAPFNPAQKVRFRSSTNVEDSGTFTGAGLYDSYSGCLADDQDADEAGPSLCDASKLKERGVFRAIRKVFASFYNDNAFLERLRFGVNESDVGMALLVHRSFPDEIELANGVARVNKGGSPSYQLELVTQAGAVSVTNPTGEATPEVVSVYANSLGVYPNIVSESSLVPLGSTVMTWDSDYLALVDLLALVADAFAATAKNPNYFALDLEYKLVKEEGLVVKQVREIPLPSTAFDVPVYLVNSPVQYCIFQGEYGDVVGNHRMKSRFAIETRNTWLDAAGISSSLFTDMTFEHRTPGDAAPLSGAPSTFPQANFQLGIDGNTTTTEDSWTTGTSEVWTWTVSTPIDEFVPGNQIPLKTYADLYAFIKVDYPSPKPTFEWSQTPGFTSSDYTRFDRCPEDVVITDQFSLQSRDAIGPGGQSIATEFYWPPAPTGIVAGYTAPLVAFEHTTITGFTTEPIVLSDYWSQTYRPGHHNFSERFVFEPALSDSVTAQQLSELEAAGIQYFMVESGYQSGVIFTAGTDMVFSELKN